MLGEDRQGCGVRLDGVRGEQSEDEEDEEEEEEDEVEAALSCRLSLHRLFLKKKGVEEGSLSYCTLTLKNMYHLQESVGCCQTSG